MGEGDSTVSVFDSAPRAVEAALAANRALAAEPWPPGIRIAVRWGIHTGEAERARRELPRPERDPRGAAARAGRRRPDLPLLGDLRARRGAPARGLLARRPRPAPAQGPRRARADLRARRARASMRRRRSTDCPYRGLLAFEAGDERFFFGREAVVADLVARLAAGRLLAVVGASGSGKSSVLRAGLVAAARAGAVAGIDDAVLVDARRRARARRARRRPRRLLVVDQFEELFIAVRRRRRGAPPSSTRCWRRRGRRRDRPARRRLRAPRRAPAPRRRGRRATRCCSAR